MDQGKDWERLKELFDEAVLLAPAEWKQFIDERCGADAKLKERLQGLLSAHEAATEFLVHPTGPDSVTRSAGVAGQEPGSLIGPYKLLQRIGEGGFGVVYMAEQQRPIVRRVALKIIKHGMDTRQVVARFEAERQALALMEHPNIAQVFDAGATDTGRPYFVMELVRGIPITEYCDQENLSNRERLELFLPVLEAVQHAHQKGIIHRDLKPGNVLVTLHDGRPVPKIIDFGIAKATSMKLTERTLFTEYGQFIGTPEYMSPEQAAMSGLDVDTRSDIYSLGAMLYELLTGLKPIEPARLRSLAMAELQRVIREEEPVKPSTRASGHSQEITQAAQHRGLMPAALAHALRGEPDWIVMKALSKDRTRRYDSASAFAADIMKYLRGEPVSAGPPGTAYRVTKFLRRHRVAAGVTALTLTAVLMGGALATVGFVRARRAEAVARLEAKRNALEVDAMRALCTDDESAYLERIREALALERRASAGNPQRLALYMTNLVGFINGLAWLGDATPDWLPGMFMREIDSEAISLLLAIPPSDDLALREAVDLMTSYAEHRRPELLLPLLRKSVEFRERMARADSSLKEARTRLATALNREGDRLMAAGRPADARPLLEESLGRWRTITPSGRTEVSEVQGSLGRCLLSLNRYSEAETLLVEAYRALNRREDLLRVVDLYSRWGKPEEARRYDQAMMVDEVRELGPLPAVGSIVSRDLGYSGRLAGRSIWLFGCRYIADSRASSRSRVNISTWCGSRDENAADGITLEQAIDPEGRPAQLLTLTAEEAARAAADSSLEITLRPGPLITDSARRRSLVVYSLLVGPKGDWKQDPLGCSIAVWKDGDARPARPVLRPGTPEPTLLFQANEPQLSSGAVAVGDTLYLYATKPIYCSHSVSVAKAPLARCLEHDAWRYYAGSGRWTENWTEAIEIMQASPHLTVHWNAYLRKYLAVTSQTLANTIELRTADHPEGPWSERHVIESGVEPPRAGLLNYAALGHGELAREGGRIEYLTYRHPIDSFNHEIRLMEIVLR
jgi:serine/threonine protein kinase/tetratricopeptide (TPR) repeat protein